MTPRQAISRFAHHLRRSAWDVAVNVAASSVACPRSVRFAIYRACRIDIDRSAVLSPSMYFQSNQTRVGARSFVNRKVRFFGGNSVIAIGDDVEIAMGVTFVTETHDIGPPTHRAGAWRTRPISVGDGCWIGANVLVLPGVHIAPGCVIAAGAVVASDCSPNGLYAGIPARRIKDLPAETTCTRPVAEAAGLSNHVPIGVSAFSQGGVGHE
jgi:maltose O-acetyltransferase